MAGRGASSEAPRLAMRNLGARMSDLSLVVPLSDEEA
jgi:hypothetical protein